MKVVTIARKPLGTASVTANVQTWSTGALSVDRSRTGSDGGGTHCTRRGPDGRCLGHRNEGRSTSGETFHGPETSGGRWPANVVLQHLAGCVVRGTRRVRTGVAVKRHGVSSEGVTGWGKAPPGTPDHGYAEEDGLETVADWRCERGCPVAALDAQSGNLASGSGTVKRRSGRESDGHRGAAYGAESRAVDAPQIWYGDQGGASRFFRHVRT